MGYKAGTGYFVLRPMNLDANGKPLRGVGFCYVSGKYHTQAAAAKRMVDERRLGWDAHIVSGKSQIDAIRKAGYDNGIPR